MKRGAGTRAGIDGLTDEHAPAGGAAAYASRTIGIALFLLLPVLRVVLMLIVFLRERDYRFSAIAALVLRILLVGFVLGTRVPSAIAR